MITEEARKFRNAKHCIHCGRTREEARKALRGWVDMGIYYCPDSPTSACQFRESEE